MLEPILILSDLHLGHKASRGDSATMFEPLLDGVRTLILNGDTHQELTKSFREKSDELLHDLKALCAEKEIELILLHGNHDPNISERGHVFLAEGKILITHGDAIFAEGAPWNHAAIQNEAAIHQLLENTTVTSLEERLALARKVAAFLASKNVSRSKHIIARVLHAAFPPERAVRMLLSWHQMKKQVLLFMKQYAPQAEVIIYGHFHRPSVWLENRVLMINTGAFQSPGNPLWVTWQNGELHAGKIGEHAGKFIKHPAKYRWRW